MKSFSLYLVILLFNSSFAQTLSDSSNRENRPMDKFGFYVKIGDTIPNITFNLDDKSTISLHDLRGKVVLLQFTASWCGVCREEMPHIERNLWQKYKDKGLYVLGVDYDEPLSKVKKFKKQIKITYPLALDPEAKIFTQFAEKFSGVIRNVVLDQSGKVIYLTRLFKIEEFNLMVEAIEKQLEIK
jgi:peroxiredoxin